MLYVPDVYDVLCLQMYLLTGRHNGCRAVETSNEIIMVGNIPLQDSVVKFWNWKLRLSLQALKLNSTEQSSLLCCSCSVRGFVSREDQKKWQTSVEWYSFLVQKVQSKEAYLPWGWVCHISYRTCQLSQNVWDTPGFTALVLCPARMMLFTPENLVTNYPDLLRYRYCS